MLVCKELCGAANDDKAHWQKMRNPGEIPEKYKWHPKEIAENP